jgi:hypothetical protein
MSFLARRIDKLDFDHPFMIRNGTVTDAPANTYAPTVTHDADNDISIDQLPGNTWQAISGFTGQYSYNGAVMHSSEGVSDAIAEFLAEVASDAPGTVFAVVTVADDEDDDAIGWTVVYRESA